MVEKFKIKLVERDSEGERLYQEAETLLSTRKGTLPLNRDFGMDWDMLSEPIEEAQNDLMVSLAEQVERFIPGLAIAEIVFEMDSEKGELIPVISFERRKGYGG